MSRQPTRSRDDELPVIRAHYDLILWLQPKIAKFPRDQRFTLGERIEERLYQILENLIHAKYGRSRIEMLERVNLDLEVLRFQTRLAKDLQCLPLKLFGESARRLIEIGQQVGAWRKAVK